MTTLITYHTGEGPPTLPDEKDPDDVLDYVVIWQDFLEAGEVIQSRSWLTDGVFTIDSSTNQASITVDGTSYSDAEIVWLSGGTTGATGLITNRITTDLGRTADRSFYLVCASQ